VHDCECITSWTESSATFTSSKRSSSGVFPGNKEGANLPRPSPNTSLKLHSQVVYKGFILPNIWNCDSAYPAARLAHTAERRNLMMLGLAPYRYSRHIKQGEYHRFPAWILT